MTAENQRTVAVTVSHCMYCGGTSIVRAVAISQTAQALEIGLSFRTGFFMVGTEAIVADVCEDCGSLVRLFVKTPRRNWLTE